MAKTNAAFMSGVPELLVLRLLMQEERYGYEIVRGIRQATGDSINLAEGVIYPTLHTLEEKGYLKARPRNVDGRTRIYYKVTAKGKTRFEKISKQWQDITQGVNSCLEPGYA